jgi:hypothetical protein
MYVRLLCTFATFLVGSRMPTTSTTIPNFQPEHRLAPATLPPPPSLCISYEHREPTPSFRFQTVFYYSYKDN